MENFLYFVSRICQVFRGKLIFFVVDGFRDWNLLKNLEILGTPTSTLRKGINFAFIHRFKVIFFLKTATWGLGVLDIYESSMI